MLTGLILVTVAVATASGVFDHSSHVLTQIQQATPTEGPRIQLDNPIAPEVAVKQHAVAAVGGLRIQIPSVGFDVPLGAINVADGQLTPPGVWSAYWVRNLGTSPQQPTRGAVFVVIHTVRGDPYAPGNRLVDQARGTSAVPIGATINDAGHTYRVTRTSVVSKAELPTRTDVWFPAARTLVLITCLERASSSVAISNVVVWAQLT